MNKELLKIVSEDLEYITREWNITDINDANLRRSSTILRRLLIDGDLFKVASLIEIKKLRVLGSKNEYLSLPKKLSFQAGGGKYKNMQVKETFECEGVLTPDKIVSIYKMNKQKNEPIELRKFMQLPSITIRETKINREEIIKYVCNKLGGSHYNAKRKTNNALEEKYALLDKYRDSNKLAEKDAIYFELLSIGQRLVNNKDIQKLKKKIKNYLQEKE